MFEFESPNNEMEKAAASCNIDQLAKEIERMRREKQDFNLSDYVRPHVIIILMTFEESAAETSSDHSMSQMVDFLASEGLDFSLPPSGSSGQSCLMAAASLNSQLCRALIRQGADVNAVDGHGRTALFYAFDSTTVQLLLDGGIDSTVNLRDVLLNARDESVLDLLIDSCIDHETESESGKIILSVLGRFNNNRIVGIVEKMMRTIPYSVQQRIKINEYLGCFSASSAGHLDVEEDPWTYWERAIELGSAQSVSGIGLPYYDNPNGLHADKSWLRMCQLYFRVISAHHGDDKNENGIFVVNGIRLLLTVKNSQLGESDFGDIFRIFDFLVNGDAHNALSCDLAPIAGDGPVTVNVHLYEYIVVTVTFFDKLLAIASGESERAELEQLIDKFVKLNLEDLCNWTPLHFSILSRSDEIVRMMLDCGANARVRSEILGSNAYELYVKNRIASPQFYETMYCFVKNGAHFDEKMHDGVRVFEFIRDRGLSELQEGKHVTLKCLAARAIADGGINYEGEVPETLKQFIDLHK